MGPWQSWLPAAPAVPTAALAQSTGRGVVEQSPNRRRAIEKPDSARLDEVAALIGRLAVAIE